MTTQVSPVEAPPEQIKAAPKVEKVKAKETPIKMLLKEIETGPIQSKEDADIVLTILARSRSQEATSTKKPLTVLDQNIVGLAAILQLHEGLSLDQNNPLPLDHDGRIINVDRVIKDTNGEVVLGSGNDTPPLSGVIADAVGDINRLLPPLPTPPATDSAETAFLRAYVKSKEKGGPKVEVSVLKEAARAHGIILAEDLVNKAAETPDKNAKDRPPLLTKTDQEILNGTWTPTKEGEVAPALSANGQKVKAILGDSIIPSIEQTQSLLKDVFEVPTNSGDFKTRMDEVQAQYETQKQKFSHMTISAGDTNSEKAFEEARVQLQRAEEEQTAMLKVQTEIESAGGGKWDLVTSYYSMMNTGEQSQNISDSFLAAIVNPTEKAIENLDKAYTQRIGEKKESDRAKKKKQTIMNVFKYGGGGFAALAAFQLWRASKKDKEQ